jgi:hypothetical protein
MRGQTHWECTRCGHVRDVNEYEPGNPVFGHPRRFYRPG